LLQNPLMRPVSLPAPRYPPQFLFAAGVLLLGLTLSLVAAAATGEDDNRITVVVHQHDDAVHVDVRFRVGVHPPEAWDVLTDFDHLVGVVTSLESSKILSRSGTSIVVHQRGKATRGLLTFGFDTIREVKLTPYEEIRSHLISGTLKMSEGLTQLSSDGDGTLIVNHGEFTPNFTLPPILGVQFIEAETRKQFGELRDEMLRRVHRQAMPAASR
jgi:hypothetical protein